MVKILNYKDMGDDEIFSCRKASEDNVDRIVEDIIDNVRKNGDKALIEYAEKFDKAKITSLEVTKEEIDEAFNSLDEYFIDTLKEAKANIEFFHEKQKKEGFEERKDGGIILGQKYTPIEKAGIYVPGGTASYPSTVLMNAIPAKIAGVKEIIMTTPPKSDGKIAAPILAAAKIAGVDKIFKTGGAGAIAALAYSTESIPRVDKIVGPGNVFVATAKRMVYSLVDIDMIAGPSEILVIADESANPKFVAADMLSQAEHDRMASAVLVTTSENLANKVALELEDQMLKLPRYEICRESIDKNGKIIIAESIEEAIEVSNRIAPEHLEVCVENAYEYLPKIKNAGSIFLGYNAPEALGDYFAGPNHTLPTSGTAKFSSPLSVDDFVKKSSYIYYTKEALSKVKDRVSDFAEREGLSAHARSVTIRFDEE